MTHITGVQLIIVRSICEGNGAWADLMKAISKQHSIKNWMTVRNQLQELINAGVIVRVRDVSNEIYVLNPKR